MKHAWGCGQDPVLGDEVLVPEKELLVDGAGDVGEESFPIQSLPGGSDGPRVSVTLSWTLPARLSVASGGELPGLAMKKPSSHLSTMLSPIGTTRACGAREEPRPGGVVLARVPPGLLVRGV